ncbi:hypothetical protein POM88_033548 [Heracleum sosnowskyi]|uniref:Arginosuccinate synthase-like N-terminal domain-containing protein n=1 Tax=Heracleum sosnowskyi TaxID=360622 RepID=A0AAD8MIL7_9APIA|nr:hypothetical protein POM88_033548 [Heracleum sosnowskyi]
MLWMMWPEKLELMLFFIDAQEREMIRESRNRKVWKKRLGKWGMSVSGKGFARRICERLCVSLRTGAVYKRKYLLGTSMARPVIAKAMVDVAREVGAELILFLMDAQEREMIRCGLNSVLWLLAGMGHSRQRRC